MIITIPWLKEHLKTSAKENEIIDRLTNIGLEVEGVTENSGEMGKFKIAKVLKAEKHPNADKLKVCDVTIGGKEILKVVCGAPNAREGLITIYAPPGAIIPKTNFELKIAKIPKSVNIPMQEIPKRLNELNKDIKYAVLCHSGVRSYHVATYLEKEGFYILQKKDP